MQSDPRDETGSLITPGQRSASLTERRDVAYKLDSQSSDYLEEVHADDRDKLTAGEVVTEGTAGTHCPSERPLPIRRFSDEIISLLLAAASLVGLLILLKWYDTKPNPQWSFGNWGITLNAIVSIVSAVFRGSLLMPVAGTISQLSWVWYIQSKPLQDLLYYDSASRGPLGSIRLLWRLRFMNLASVGAVITLAALALDPFFQQSIQYVSKGVVDANQKAQAVTAYTWGADIPVTGEFANRYVAIPYNMKAAISSGLLSANTLSMPSPPFSCPTGNCTWNAFATLAVGTQCQDVTSHVQIECPDQICRFVAPGDDSLADHVNGSGPYAPLLLQSDPPILLTGGAGSAMSPYLNNTASLALVQWIKTTKDNIIKSTSSFEAVRCNFYLSVKEVLPNVVNGAYSEEVLQEVTRPEPVQGLNYSDENFPVNYFLNPWFIDDYGPIIYQLDGSDPSNIGNNYTFRLNGNEFSALSSQLIEDRDFLWSEKLMTGTGGAEEVGSTTLIMLWQAENTTRAMYNLADAITTQMRASSSNILQQERQDASLIAPDQAVDGQVWVQQQTVVVRWSWLILPIVLLGMAILLVLASFVETRRKRVGLWKSSPLTLFFHARFVDQSVQQELASNAVSLNTAEAMEKAASALTARIPKHAHETIEVYPRAGVGLASRKDIKLMARDSLEQET